MREEPCDEKACRRMPFRTEQCVKELLRVRLQEGPARLRDLLPVFFDSCQVYCREEQERILRTCGMEPVMEGGRVTIRV
jgi:hypothetical protein